MELFEKFWYLSGSPQSGFEFVVQKLVPPIYGNTHFGRDDLYSKLLHAMACWYLINKIPNPKP